MGPPARRRADRPHDVRRDADVQPDDHQRPRPAGAALRLRRAADRGAAARAAVRRATRSASQSSATRARWCSGSTPTAWRHRTSRCSPKASSRRSPTCRRRSRSERDSREPGLPSRCYAARVARLSRAATSKAATTCGSNCVPAQRCSSCERRLRIHPRAVGAVLRHRVVGVADGDDPRAERDLLAGERVGVARAVPALVAGADHRRDRREARRGGDDALADQRVAAHELPLVVVERPGLGEDLVGDRDLADVVELGGQAHVVHLVARGGRAAARRARRARRRRRRAFRARGSLSARIRSMTSLASSVTEARPRRLPAYRRLSAIRSASLGS